MEGFLILVALAVVAVGAVRFSLRRHPYAPCRRCNGGGRNAGSNRKRHGMCGKCGGSGRRWRIGARRLARKD